MQVSRVWKLSANDRLIDTTCLRLESCLQKQPFRRVLKKKCSKTRQQIYRRTTMPKCNFSLVNLLHIIKTPFHTNTSGGVTNTDKLNTLHPPVFWIMPIQNYNNHSEKSPKQRRMYVEKKKHVCWWVISRGSSRTAAKSKMERSILNVAAVLDSPLQRN